MGGKSQQISLAEVLGLAAKQHGVVTRGQLLDLGLGSRAIDHRIRRGKLHPVHRGVYAVGRPQLTRHGVLIAAVLSCGLALRSVITPRARSMAFASSELGR